MVTTMKERIIKGSEELFFKFGIRSVTMDDIAKHLSVSKKTIAKKRLIKKKVAKKSAAKLKKTKAKKYIIYYCPKNILINYYFNKKTNSFYIRNLHI